MVELFLLTTPCEKVNEFSGIFGFLSFFSPRETSKFPSVEAASQVNYREKALQMLFAECRKRRSQTAER
jgi:hypothetical protein